MEFPIRLMDLVYMYNLSNGQVKFPYSQVVGQIQIA